MHVFLAGRGQSGQAPKLRCQSPPAPTISPPPPGGGGRGPPRAEAAATTATPPAAGGGKRNTAAHRGAAERAARWGRASARAAPKRSEAGEQ